MLLAGEPGVGKSTLLLDVAARAARAGIPTLYVTGEESVAQVRLRADRIRAVHAKLWFAAETDLAAVLGQIDAVKPGLLIVDSVQTFSPPKLKVLPAGSRRCERSRKPSAGSPSSEVSPPCWWAT